MQENAKDMYLACAFLCQSDRKRYIRFPEELENGYTKGNSNYPTDLVTTYRMISEYKNWQPSSSVPESDGVAFAQQTRGRPNNVNQIEDWIKDKECYKCGQKGHIATVCPAKKSKNDLEDDDKSKKSPTEPSRRKNHSEKKKKESKQFVQEDDEEDEESNDHGFASFGLCTVNKRNHLQLRNMLLLDSCSTVDLFCNKKLVTNIWESKNSMTVKVNGGDLKTHKKAYVENYG